MKPGILISIFFFLLTPGCRNPQSAAVEEDTPRVRVIAPVVREISILYMLRVYCPQAMR
jgi:hypothetical protein